MTKRSEKSKLKKKERKRQKIDGKEAQALEMGSDGSAEADPDTDVDADAERCKKKLVYVCFSGAGESLELFRFDPCFKGDLSKLSPAASAPVNQSPSPVLDKIRKEPHACTYARCGSTIYAFGGAFQAVKIISPDVFRRFSQFNGTKDIFMLNFDKSGCAAWTQLSVQMNASRHSPLVLVVGTKIYIFSSTYAPVQPDPWGEVFDTVSNTVTPLLHNPPHPLTDCPPKDLRQPVVYDNILYFPISDTDLYSYDLESGEWNEVSELYPSFPTPTSGCIVADEHILWYALGELLFVHDFAKQELQNPSSFLPFCERWPAFGKGDVLDLGDHKCCLVWASADFCYWDSLNHRPHKSFHVLNVVTFETNGCTPNIIAQAHYPIPDPVPCFALSL